jgi:hypothetical protein
MYLVYPLLLLTVIALAVCACVLTAVMASEPLPY